MALEDLSDLDRYRRRNGFPPGWEEDRDWGRVFFAPDDNVTGALVELVQSARDSLFIAYASIGYSPLDAVVQAKLNDDRCFVQFTLGQCEPFALGPTAIAPAVAVAGLTNPYQIVQAAVIDSTDVLTGSAYWPDGATSGDLVVIRDPAWVALYQASLVALHAHVLAKEEP
jgi:hypothetical protein